MKGYYFKIERKGRDDWGGEYTYYEFSKMVIPFYSLQTVKNNVIEELNKKRQQWREMVDKALNCDNIRDLCDNLNKFSYKNLQGYPPVDWNNDWLYAIPITFYEYYSDVLGMKLQDDFEDRRINIKMINEINLNENDGIYFNPVEDNMETYLPLIKYLLTKNKERTNNWEDITEFPEELEVVEVEIFGL